MCAVGSNSLPACRHLLEDRDELTSSVISGVTLPHVVQLLFSIIISILMRRLLLRLTILVVLIQHSVVCVYM